jgi:hypothetical protein
MHGGTRLDANTALLSEMVDRLGDLANNFVFAGGCATGLLITSARGNNDYGASHDLEDIITVIDGRAELDAEMRNAPEPACEYLREQFSSLISSDAFISALPNHLPPDAASQARASVVMSRLKRMASSP